MRLLYAKETALGCVLWFSGGFELEVVWSGERWLSFWTGPGGEPLACATVADA